jgi:hypothetical protein
VAELDGKFWAGQATKDHENFPFPGLPNFLCFIFFSFENQINSSLTGFAHGT